MITTKKLLSILMRVLLLLFVSAPVRALGQTAHAKAYPLSTWSNLTCRAKGRFQDRDYCASPVMDQIVSDGKSAIPVLISQIADSRWIAEPVYDYWPRIRTGELAYFILEDLFLDDTWQKSTMPPLFPVQRCDDPSWVCWEKFRKARSLKELQARWLTFWTANHDKISWDDKARCFRLSNPQDPGAKPDKASSAAIVAQAPKPHRVRVKKDIQQAKLVHMVYPVYPPVNNKRMDGTVVLHVIIGKDGAVNSVRYVSGPANLRDSAVNAVLQWRYKPTLMNGVPVEVDTTVSVVFPPPKKVAPPFANK